MRRESVLLLIPALACATIGDPGPRGPEQVAPPAARTDAEEALVPPGFGTLRQDDFTVSLRNGPLLIKVTPLSEAVIRLAAPDTYDRLHALAESRREDVRPVAGGEPELFMVSFFSYEPDVTFQPEDLQLLHRGRLTRASRVLPITPGWGSQRLRQQETQMALYVFEPLIDYDQAISVRYGLEESQEWSKIISRLEAERARVRGRGTSAGGAK